MRVSTDESDPGYANWRGRQFEVRVNGKLLTHCITADEESGWAMYQVVDQLGKHVWSVHGRELMVRSVSGRVQIIDVARVTPGVTCSDEQSARLLALRNITEALVNKQCAQSTDEPPVKIAVAPDVMVRDLR